MSSSLNFYSDERYSACFKIYLVFSSSLEGCCEDLFRSTVKGDVSHHWELRSDGVVGELRGGGSVCIVAAACWWLLIRGKTLSKGGRWKG